MVTGVRLLVTRNSDVVDHQNLCLDSITMVFHPPVGLNLQLLPVT